MKIRTFARSLIEQHAPGLGIVYRNFRDLMDRHDRPIATRWGFSLAGNPAMAQGLFEPEETSLIRALLGDVDLFVNVGANVGYYCCHALSLGKPVIAVEPVARNLHYLLTNIRNNGWANRAEVFPVALAGNTDILDLWGGGTGASLVRGWASIPASYVTQVPVLTLDRLVGGGEFAGRRALIVVDIEGAEMMLLQGASRTLASDPRPVWLVEICSTEHQPAGTRINPHFAQTFEVFLSEGYRAFTADALALEVTWEVVQDVVAGDRDFQTHNFIFR